MSPTLYAARGHVKPHMHINKAMAFNIILVYSIYKSFLVVLIQKRFLLAKATVHGNKKPFNEKKKRKRKRKKKRMDKSGYDACYYIT